ncbi:GDSL-type esterase/lipase family protein [Geofilum rubicundum]|uniref:GDSL-type esterase/lipase family protein n=1 Tax=Geofilum rubicundum TaxID=472113 RepID=UPI0007819EF7|nr:GDSL-type esterase/lipase family protein [Geofilum rubicundum]
MKQKNLLKALIVAFVLVTAACQQSHKGIVDVRQYNQPVKVACVGNSITFGAGIEHRDSLSYPAQLQRMLGENWEVQNFGVSARTLMSSGDLPYIQEPDYQSALDFDPDVVLIKLGTNDTKPHNWQHSSSFKEDYKKLIASFQALPSQPIVVLLKAVPAFPERWGISDSTIVHGLNPMVEELAQELHLPCIDLYTPMMGRDTLFPDQIHPNAEGAGIMAHTIYEALTGRTVE